MAVDPLRKGIHGRTNVNIKALSEKPLPKASNGQSKILRKKT
jgi:hypothetical protein